MSKHILTTCFSFLLICQFAIAQQVGSYRSKQNGVWNASTTWEKFDGTAWIDLVAPDYPNNATLDVSLSHTVTVTTTAPAPPYRVRNLTVQSSGKVFANANVVTPRYLNIYGNVVCDGIIGNYPTADDIGLSIEGASCTISGSSPATSFAVTRLRKASNAAPSTATTNLTISRSLYTTYNHPSFGNTQILNNAASTFNVTIAQSVNVNCSGSVCIDGNVGTDGTNIRGSVTVNGTLNIGGTLYLKTNNTGTQANAFTIGTTGIVNANSIDAGASVGPTTTAGHIFTMQGNGVVGGRLNITGPSAFIAYSTTGNTYVLQPATTIAYASTTGAQIIQPLNYRILEISNPSGTTLTSNLTVNEQLNLSGIITTNANIIHITSNASNAISGYGTTSYINGNLRRNVTPGNVYAFPIGTNAQYELAVVGLNAATGLSNLTASFTPGLPSIMPDPNETFINGTAIYGMLNAGYWTVEPDAYTTINYDITLYERGWNNFTGVPPQLGVIKREDAASPWLGTNTSGGPGGNQGYHSNATQSINGETAIATRTGLTSLSDFGIGFGNTPLPVELSNFTAFIIDRSVQLNWQTESETNNEYFSIERSSQQKGFHEIGLVEGHGNATTSNSYRGIDTDPEIGYNYYRLKQVDHDGSFSYSPIRVVEFEEGFQSVYSVYPVPASDFINVNGLVEGDMVYILGPDGSIKHKLSASKASERIDVSSWTAGVYLLKIENYRAVQTIRFSKN